MTRMSSGAGHRTGSGSTVRLSSGSGLVSPRPILSGGGNVEGLGISPSPSCGRIKEARYREYEFVEKCSRSRYARVNFDLSSCVRVCAFVCDEDQI